MDRRFIDINNGTIYKRLATFWFSLLGFVAAIVTIELVAKGIDSLAVSVVAKVSYIFLLFWLQANVNDAIWWFKPEYHPEHEFSLRKENRKALWKGGRYSALICVGVYFFVEHVIEVIAASGHA